MDRTARQQAGAPWSTLVVSMRSIQFALFVQRHQVPQANRKCASRCKEVSLCIVCISWAAQGLCDNLVAAWREPRCVDRADGARGFPQAIEQILDGRWIGWCIADSPRHRAGTKMRRSAGISRRRWRSCASRRDRGANLLVISSDAVFAGPKLFHDESEPVAGDGPCQHLHAVEQAALAFSDRTRVLVVRTNAIGWSRNGASFAERVWDVLERHERIEVDASSFATPVLAVDAAELLWCACRARLSGVIHIVGAERTSPYRFALELADAAGFDRRRVVVKENGAAESDSSAHRETSLASRLVRRELGVSLPLLRETVKRFVEQAADGHRDLIRGVTTGALQAA